MSQESEAFMQAFSSGLFRDICRVIPPAIWMGREEYDYWADIVYRLLPDAQCGADPLHIYGKLLDAGYINEHMGVRCVRKVLRYLVRQKRAKKVIDMMNGDKTVFLRLNVL